MHRCNMASITSLAGLLSVWTWAHADHPTIAFGAEAAGPIITIAAAPLPARTTSAGVRAEVVNFDRFSNRELAGFAAAGEEGVHSTDRLVNASLSLARGITDDLTLSARLPYVDRQNIRESEIEDGEAEAHDHGDSSGIGDLSVLAHYRFLDAERLDASVIGGIKAPTGRTDVRDGGEKLETEFQPGTGSWDALLGAAASLGAERFGLHGNILYNLTTEGSQDTEIGDAFFCNLAMVYSLSDGEDEAHRGHAHSHLKWDIMLELNGEYRDNNEIDGDKEENSGGEVIFLSPGIRLSSSDRWSMFLSAGKSIYDDFNGIQADVDYRVVGGVGFVF